MLVNTTMLVAHNYYYFTWRLVLNVTRCWCCYAAEPVEQSIATAGWFIVLLCIIAFLLLLLLLICIIRRNRGGKYAGQFSAIFVNCGRCFCVFFGYNRSDSGVKRYLKWHQCWWRWGLNSLNDGRDDVLCLCDVEQLEPIYYRKVCNILKNCYVRRHRC